MDQSEAPILDALVDYRKANRYGFTPPAHRQGRGVDHRVLSVLGREPFQDDLLSTGGLDDRRSRGKVLQRAEDLMAEAVGADVAWFSTCGSSHLPFHEDLPTWAMDAGADVCVVSVHKMGAGFEQGSVFHLQGDLIDQDRLSACADLLMTTSPNVLVYAAMDGWRRQMVEHGHELLDAALRLADGVRADIELIPDLEVLDDELIGVEASHDLDRLQLMMDLSATGTSGYQAADWLRENKQVDMHLSDHRRICACLSFADDKSTTDRLLDALWAWRNAARDFDPPPKIDLPGLRADRRRTDHAVSARCPGRRAGRAARRRRHRLPAHGPRGGDDAARPGRPGTGKIPGGRMKLSGTPGFVYGGSGNITDR